MLTFSVCYKLAGHISYFVRSLCVVYAGLQSYLKFQIRDFEYFRVSGGLSTV